MIIINKKYLEKVKQELIDDIENSPFLIPDLLSSITTLPNPSNFVLEFHRDKVEKKIARRKEMTNILSSDVSDTMPIIREYQEKEFLEFLKAFPKYAQLKS